MRSLAFLLLLLALPAQGEESLRIAVAANFRATLEQVSEGFQQQTGIRLSISSASTGVLANQILHGAPFDLFFAADAVRPAALRTRGIGVQEFCYARGRLVLVGSDDLAALNNGGLSLAIANPDTAPYGRAALDVIKREEFAGGHDRKLVRGNSVLQAYQFWHSAAVDLALVAQSMAGKSFVPVPLDWYQPLKQHALVLKVSPAITAYLDWIRSDRVRAQILEAGYEPCP